MDPRFEFFIKSVMTTIYLPAFTRVFLPGIKTGEDAENS
jgi:hypothetical protein